MLSRATGQESDCRAACIRDQTLRRCVTSRRGPCEGAERTLEDVVGAMIVRCIPEVPIQEAMSLQGAGKNHLVGGWRRASFR